MPPPPAATYIAFHPQDNNIITIGMDNSIMSDWVRAVYGALLGGNAEGQILAATGSIDISIRYQSAVHQDQTHFFVVHDAQLAIYEKTKLKCLKQQPADTCQFLGCNCVHIHSPYAMPFKYPPSCCRTSRRSKAICTSYVR
ncbi:topless-related protein 1-like isoform X7 [Solanum pennellii]|uniref:Topless-related protein 1-like isoform X7 n=1 Tax=Solanum pennellii TaxID=28526 RepID=A0ABM1V7R7_SOLPN|nr:topless-related protein 1-like isoform X7 [Solanum pennellii]